MKSKYKDSIYVVIEIEKDSNIKYEIKNNKLYIDRIIKMNYPHNYGYIPETLSLDNDELDAIVITKYKLIPKSIILCKPIGILIMSDESGIDNKIIAIPHKKISNEFKNINSIKLINIKLLNNIKFFFKNYKNNYKNKWSKVIGFKDENYAKKEILLSIKNFIKKNNK